MHTVMTQAEIKWMETQTNLIPDHSIIQSGFYMQRSDVMTKGMKMKLSRFRIHICPVKGIPWEKIYGNENSALVICSTTSSSCHDDKISAKRLCTVEFADVEDSSLPLSVREEQAVRIRDFIIQLKPEVSDLYVCCDSGESRSPAIAAAILKAAGLPDDVI